MPDPQEELDDWVDVPVNDDGPDDWQDVDRAPPPADQMKVMETSPQPGLSPLAQRTMDATPAPQQAPQETPAPAAEPGTWDAIVQGAKKILPSRDQLGAMGRGFFQDLYLGGSDEIEATGDWMADRVKGGDASWDELLQRAMAAEKRAAEQHPNYYGAGQGIGGAITALAPAGAVGRGASLAKQAAAAGASGGAYGQATALGKSESPDMTGRLEDAAEGGVLGAAAGAAVPLAGGALARRGSVMRKAGEQALADGAPRRVHAAGAHDQKAMREARNKQGGLQSFADDLDRFGIKSAEDAERSMQHGLSQMDDVAKQAADAGVMVDGDAIAQRIESMIEREGQGPLGQRIRGSLQQYAETFRGMGQASFNDIHQERRLLGSMLKMNKEDPLSQRQKELYGLISEELESAASFAQEGLADAWREGNRRYSIGKVLQDAAGREEQRASNRLVSLTDYLSGAGAMAGMASSGIEGGVIGGMAGAAANKFIRSNEDAIALGARNLYGGTAKRAGQAAEGFGRGVPPEASRAAGTVVGDESARKNQGGRMGETIEKTIQHEPELLGPYLDKISQASQGDKVGLAAAVYELHQSDPVFRNEIYPRIQQRAKGE